MTVLLLETTRGAAALAALLAAAPLATLLLDAIFIVLVSLRARCVGSYVSALLLLLVSGTQWGDPLPRVVRG